MSRERTFRRITLPNSGFLDADLIVGAGGGMLSAIGGSRGRESRIFQRTVIWNKDQIRVCWDLTVQGSGALLRGKNRERLYERCGKKGTWKKEGRWTGLR